MLAKPNLLVDRLMAQRLRVPLAWLRSQAAGGQLPAVQAGDRWLSNPEAVERALLERATRMPKGGGTP